MTAGCAIALTAYGLAVFGVLWGVGGGNWRPMAGAAATTTVAMIVLRRLYVSRRKAQAARRRGSTGSLS
ncbi:MAG TPA: hypothetical protein VGI68_15390 [Mycobacterium sp.]